MRVYVARRDGTVFDEIVPLVESVAWILNGIGKMRFEVAATDPKATPEHLAFGNRVYVRFSNGLPDWAGVIMPPRSWGEGKISCVAHGIEYLLQFRLTDRGRYFDSVPVGAIFAAILREAELQDPLNIIVRNIWYGGGLHSPAYHFKDVWWILTESLRGMEICDFRFYPALENGRIRWYADLQERIGRDLSGAVALAEGRNLVAGATIEEQGRIVNEAIAVGAGTTWGSDRPIAVMRDESSVAQYGLLQEMKSYPSVSSASTLEYHARRALTENSAPRRRFQIEVVDEEPGCFGAYDIGDIVRLEIPSAAWGYRGNVRVLAREYRPRDGICSLAIEEVRDAPFLRPIQSLSEEEQE